MKRMGVKFILILDLNININLVQNILEGVYAENGAPGPFNTLLQSIGLKIPKK